MFKALVVLSMLALMSCGKISSNAAPTPEVSQPSVVTPLPDNSSGVSSNEDSNHRTGQFVIPAQKKYGPTVFEDGWYYASKTIRFHLPASITVVNGRPGNHLLILKLTRAEESLKCIYQGTGSNTAAEYNSASTHYHFDFCVDESVSVTPGNRAQLKNSSSNILSIAERDQVEIELLYGEKVTLQVNNGNHKGPGGNVTTSVQGSFDFSF